MAYKVPLFTQSGRLIEAVIRVNADWPQQAIIRTSRGTSQTFEGSGDGFKEIGRINTPSGPNAWMEVTIRHKKDGQGDWIENGYQMFGPVFGNELFTLGTEDGADGDYNDCVVMFVLL